MFPPKTRILIVDDLESIREVVKAYLKRMGYKDVEEANDGVEGYQMLVSAKSGKDPYGLVLCDWNMPNLTGIELLRKVRAQNTNLPFIIMTTESEKAKVFEAIEAGVSNYVVKPVEESVLKEKMLAAWKKHNP